MKKTKLFVLPLCLLAAMLVSSAASAQTVTILAGSSGAFNSMAIASINTDPITLAAPQCGAHLWSNKASDTVNTAHARGIDPRTGVPPEPGNIWIAWDADPPTVVCAYLSVDSVVGTRLFFGVGVGGTRTTIQLDAGANNSQVGDKAVPYIDDSAVTLPTSVYTLVNGATINAGVTDIRPEDAELASQRAICPINSSLSCLGYGPFPLGTAVQSAFSSTSAQVVAFNITGNDPITTSQPVPAYGTLNIGAYPMMVFYNKTATANPGDFGNLLPTAITSHNVALIWSGLSTRTTDLGGPTSTAAQPLHVLVREPISGTYNTFEWQLVRNKGTVLSQETGVTTNPLNQTAADGATRQRVIGTGEMVSKTASTANSMGYAFWSFSTYAAAATQSNVRYLALDGNDPLFGSYAPNNGAFPTCTGLAPSITCTSLPFTNVYNGGYRSWNIIRVVADPSALAAGQPIAKLVAAAQDEAKQTLFDFVPFVVNGSSNLTVFRSHYPVPGLIGTPPPAICSNPLNGTNQAPIGPYPKYAEACGDMAGASFTVQADINYFTDTGKQLTGYIQ